MTLAATTTDAPQSVWEAVWLVIDGAASLLLTMLSIAVIAAPFAKRRWNHYKAKRAEEAEQRRKERTREISEQVEKAVGPMREQLEQIHKTTHVNGHSSKDRTMLDRFVDLDHKIDQCIALIAATATNVAGLSTRLDHAQAGGREYVADVQRILAEHGIDLPKYDQGGAD